MMLPMVTCKKRLTILWFIGAGLVFSIVLMQTLLNHFGDLASDAWAWLLPAIMPTLSLMASVWATDALGKGSQTESVDRFVFYLAFMLSAGYLLTVAVTILVQPLVGVTAQDSIAVMHRSSFLLGPLQGLVVASLGIFFVKKNAEV